MHPRPALTHHAASFLRAQKDGSVLVDIHVMPNASSTQIQGLFDGALKVRLRAPPVDGKANAALQVWLAKTLDIPNSSVTLQHGASARRKQLRVAAHATAKADWKQLSPPAPSPSG
ncbi:hypothetical protein AZ34_15975 [Hylemonella gracilis str. Niagara R]|uniref:UPF0235 protein AZ34_15975 n=1 Tax=Hylemonella gracilis str. Niagara R TaxID=1458275 RepID=A0A016XJX2_9BURK|nr:DUF167 domain-containing protein [Hylemonella gracilis]EYC52399.1 hypothetical protein AZ34_15975 [Hylemonella gracilis str. Niagara R]